MARNQELMRPLLRLARRSGFQVEHTKNGHLRIRNGDASTVLASTPSSAKASYLLKSWIRKQGLAVA